MTQFESRATGEAGEWLPVLEKLLAGVSHHISNRVSVLAGVSDILAVDPALPPVLRALADEVPQLEDGVRLLRLLASPDEPEEALEATRVVDDALALARLHPDYKDVTFATAGGDGAPPVVARPTALTHEVLVAVVAAAAAGGGAAVTVRFSEEGDDLVMSAGVHRVRARTLYAARSSRS